MNPSRRSFLRNCSFFTLGSFFAAPRLEATVVRELARRPVDPATLQLLQFVDSYSASVRLVGSGALARLKGRNPRVTQVLAEVPNLQALKTIWQSSDLPAGVFAHGNNFSFRHEAGDFAVENLLPGAYDQRVQRERRARKARFAHDAMLVNAGNGAVQDPLRSTKSSEIILNHPGGTMAEAVVTVIRGWIEAEDLDMSLDAAFGRLQQRVLDASVSRPAQAKKVLRAIVGRIAELSAVAPKRLRALFKSRLLKSTLATLRGEAAGDLVAQFDALRVAAANEVSDGALWLVVLFGEEITAGILDFLTGDPENFFSAKALETAFGQAQFIVANGPVSAVQ